MSAKTLKDKKQNIISRNLFVILAFVSSLLLMLLVYYCFDVVPFGNITTLRMDLYHQYGPLFAELSERIKHFDTLLYSFNSGMGGGFLGNFFNYLSSPLTLLIVFFKHTDIPDFIALLMVLKCALASGTFAYYIKKTTGKKDFSVTAFGILYSFCGWFIAYYWNIMWVDALYLLPIVILGIEYIINRANPFPFVISLTISFFANYYMAYMICIFSVFYFLFYYFSNYSIKASISPKKISPDDEPQKNDEIKGLLSSRFLNSGVIFAISAILAAAVAAVALIPVYYALTGSSATSGTFPSDIKVKFEIFDFLANHLASVDPTIRSSGDVVLPNVYCGVLTLILVPLYFFTKSVSKKEKALNIGFLALMFASFNINYLNYIWHGFHFPNDLPYRFSFMYSFLILRMAYIALTKIKEINRNLILGIGIGLAVFIIIVQKTKSENVTTISIYASLIATMFFVGILYLFRDKKYQTSAIALLLFCCVVSEAACVNTMNFSMSQNKKLYSSDYTRFAETKKNLDNYNQGKYYRMELGDLRTRMDPCWYNYYGISTFSSMASEDVSKLQERLGLSGNDINSYTYNPQTPVYNAMMSLQYIVNNETQNFAVINYNPNYYEELEDMGKDFSVYKNKYNLPIAYGVPNAILDWDYDRDNPVAVQSEYFKLATGIDDVFESLKIDNIDFDNVTSFDWDGAYGGFNFERIDPDSEGMLTFNIVPEKTGSIYFYLDCNDVENIKCTVNGKTYSREYDERFLVDIGYCKAGETATVEIKIPEDCDTEFIDFGAYTINNYKFVTGYRKLLNNTLKIESQSETDIKGLIKMDYSGKLYTSIPYDEGWTVYIDGKVQGQNHIHALGDALMCIDITAGSHSVELKYMPRGLKLGLIISFFSLAFLILLIFVYRTKIYGSYKKSFSMTSYQNKHDTDEKSCDTTESDINLSQQFKYEPDKQNTIQENEQDENTNNQDVIIETLKDEND